jgi:hypothetical protein
VPFEKLGQKQVKIGPLADFGNCILHAGADVVGKDGRDVGLHRLWVLLPVRKQESVHNGSGLRLPCLHLPFLET